MRAGVTVRADCLSPMMPAFAFVTRRRSCHCLPATSRLRNVFDASPAPDLGKTAKPRESLRDADMGRRDPLRMEMMCL